MKLFWFPEKITVFTLSLFLFLFGIASSGIYILDESKNAQCSYEMMTRGDGVTPTFNGELRTDKPPLHYYFMMLGYQIWGKSNIGARFFSGLAGSFFMLMFFIFLKRYAPAGVAWPAVIVLWSSIMFVVEFHLAVPDPYLIVCVGLSLMCFYHAVEGKALWRTYGIYIFSALGVLAKGPVAILLPGLIILLYLLLLRQLNWPLLSRLKPLWGILIFGVIALPWYYAVSLKTDGEWIRGFFMEHNINRFSDVKEGHGGLFILTFLYYLLGFLPLLFFWPVIVRYVWQNRHERLLTLSILTTLVFCLFFTFSQTKLPNYAMPAFPFTAIAIGYWINGGNLKNLSGRGFWAYLVFSVLALVAVYFAIRQEPNLIGLNSLVWCLAGWPAGGLIALYFFSKKMKKSALYSLLWSQVLTVLLLMGVFFPIVDRRNPVVMSENIIAPAIELAYIGHINPAFVFRYGTIRKLNGSDEVCRFLSDPGHLLITTQKELLRHSEWIPYEVVFQSRDLFDSRETRILRAKP